MSRTVRFGILGTLLAAGVILAGCTVDPQTRSRVHATQNGNGTVTLTVLPPPGSNGRPQTVLLPPGVIPPNVLSQLTGGTASLPPVKPGNGGSAGTDPQQPAKTPPNPPPSSVTNPTKPPATGGSTTEKARLEADTGMTITGKDANNSEYLTMLRTATGFYPAGTFKGLQVILDEESLDKTGGVGGVWQSNGQRARVTVYQAGSAYIHVSIHELAHHLDLWVNDERVTPDLMNAAKVNGTIPANNIPSAYAKYGLQNPQNNAEWGAEVISWSLDTRGVPGFASTPTWHPTSALMKTLGKYVEPSKILFK